MHVQISVSNFSQVKSQDDDLDLNQINQDFIDQNDLIHKNNNSSTQSEDIQTESQLGMPAMTVTDKYYGMTTQFDSNDGLKKLKEKLKEQIVQLLVRHHLHDVF